METSGAGKNKTTPQHWNENWVVQKEFNIKLLKAVRESVQDARKNFTSEKIVQQIEAINQIEFEDIAEQDEFKLMKELGLEVWPHELLESTVPLQTTLGDSYYGTLELELSHLSNITNSMHISLHKAIDSMKGVIRLMKNIFLENSKEQNALLAIVKVELHKITEFLELRHQILETSKDSDENEKTSSEIDDSFAQRQAMLRRPLSLKGTSENSIPERSLSDIKREENFLSERIESHLRFLHRKVHSLGLHTNKLRNFSDIDVFNEPIRQVSTCTHEIRSSVEQLQQRAESDLQKLSRFKVYLCSTDDDNVYTTQEFLSKRMQATSQKRDQLWNHVAESLSQIEDLMEQHDADTRNYMQLACDKKSVRMQRTRRHSALQNHERLLEKTLSHVQQVLRDTDEIKTKFQDYSRSFIFDVKEDQQKLGSEIFRVQSRTRRYDAYWRSSIELLISACHRKKEMCERDVESLELQVQQATHDEQNEEILHDELKKVQKTRDEYLAYIAQLKNKKLGLSQSTLNRASRALT